MKISAIVLIGGKFDKGLLKKCLGSLSWADEIVKVEADKLKGSFSDWRNEGAKRAKGDWLLYVDSDEEVTPELKREITEVVKEGKAGAYALPRRNFIFGKEFKHSGQWPDYQIRLFKKGSLKRWEGELHERPVFEGELGYLAKPLIHRKHESLAEMVEKTNRWSEIEAKLMFQANHPPMNVLRFVSAILREFWIRMVRQGAFLDGAEGVIYALYQVFSRFTSYAKLWERQLALKER